jgi:hypothetical protein
MKKNLKNMMFAVTTIIFVLVLIETFSFLFFNVFKDRFTFFDINQYLLTDTVITYAHQKYHSERGWDTKYNTQFGERPRKVSYNKAYIATFGNSFTHCDQVKHHETWQEYLSSLLKQDVYNFGTGGYGTDQAYMKFLEKYPKVKTPVVILGLITENINRIVNVYRPFYFSRTGQRVTKPRFKVLNNKLVLLKNPIADEKDMNKLKSSRFINEIGQNDFWYNRNNYPILIFPYSKILLNKRMWFELIYNKKGYQIDDMNPRPWENLWEDKDATDIMYKIFESFIAKVKAEKAIPIIMVIPNKQEVAMKLETGKETENTLKILEFCRLNNCHYFNPIDGFVEYVKNGNASSSLYRGHISPKGNLIIASQLFQYLKDIADSE